MRRMILAGAAAAAMRCFGIAASQAWVEQYVSNYVARTAAEVQAGTTVVSSNGSTVVTASTGTGSEMRLVVQDFSDAALLATNCTASANASGVTNGCLFVWNGAGAYINPAGTVSCTSSNLVWEGVGSVFTNGVDRFPELFDVLGVLVQPHTSLSVTNGMMEAGL